MRAPITDARRIPPRIPYTIVPVIIGVGIPLMFDILIGIYVLLQLFDICKCLLLLRCVVPFRVSAFELLFAREAGEDWSQFS